MHLTLAADIGRSDGNSQEEVCLILSYNFLPAVLVERVLICLCQTLKVLHFSQVSYVNVDTSTHKGIARAKNLNLVSSGLADVVISPLLYEASSLFIPTRRGASLRLSQRVHCRILKVYLAKPNRIPLPEDYF